MSRTRLYADSCIALLLSYGKMTHMIAEETDFLAKNKPWELYRKIKQ